MRAGSLPCSFFLAWLIPLLHWKASQGRAGHVPFNLDGIARVKENPPSQKEPFLLSCTLNMTEKEKNENFLRRIREMKRRKPGWTEHYGL